MAAQATPLRAASPVATQQRAPVLVPTSTRAADLVKWLVAAPLLAVGGLVVLYGLGALWKWGQVRDAGLDPIDVLPLVPRGELVTLGVELVLVTLVALPVTLALIGALHLALPDAGRAWGVPFGLARLTAEQDRVRRDLDELRADAGADELVGRRVHRVTARAARVRARIVRRTWAGRIGLLAVAVAAFALSTPAALLVAACGLWLVRRLGGGVARIAFAVFAGLLLAGVAERFAAPEPLPEASVRTTRGVLVKAPLLTHTRDAWYLVVDDRRLKAVPTANVAKSSLAYDSPRGESLLASRPVDAHD